jgi:adenine phosphoribosyltransferase
MKYSIKHLEEKIMNLKDYVASVPDFPKEGILFRDITPLLSDSKAFTKAIDLIVEFGKKYQANIICGPEARGFIFGTPIAYALHAGFVPIRKPGKLPRKAVTYEYDLEYGSNSLSMHEDAVKKGDKVLIVDDLLATGGTLEATIKLIESRGGTVVGIACIIELDDLEGRKKLEGYNVYSLMHY